MAHRYELHIQPEIPHQATCSACFGRFQTSRNENSIVKWRLIRLFNAKFGFMKNCNEIMKVKIVKFVLFENKMKLLKMYLEIKKRHFCFDEGDN